MTKYFSILSCRKTKEFSVFQSTKNQDFIPEEDRTKDVRLVTITDPQ